MRKRTDAIQYRSVIVALVGAALLGVVVSSAAAQNILFIGNSFTIYQSPNTPAMVQSLAVSAGFAQPNINYSVSVPGVDLTWHRKDAATLNAISSGYNGQPWDYVVLQELSSNPTNYTAAPVNGNPGQFEADATWLYDDIKQYNPSAHVVLYETWARAPAYGWYGPGLYFANYADMQSQLHANYYDAAQNYIPAHSAAGVKTDVTVAPCGDAWQANFNAQSLTLHNTDNYHQNDAGAYLNALVLFDTIYARSSAGLSYNGNLTSGSAAYLQGIADQTVHAQSLVIASGDTSSLSSISNITSTTVNGTLDLNLTAPSNLAGTLSIGTRGVVNAAPTAPLTISAAQSNSSGAVMNLTSGATILNSDAGSASSRTLSVTTASGGGGATTLTFNVNQHLHALTVGDATVVTLAARGASPASSRGGRVIVTDSLSLGTTSHGVLDLANNALIWKGAGTTGEQQVLQWINAAYDQGAWDAPAGGLTCSLLKAGSGGDPSRYALAYALADEVSGMVGSTFYGEPVASGDVLVMYTIRGDVSFAGSAGFDTLIAVLGNLNGPGDWEHGNFHYGVSGPDVNLGFDDMSIALNNLDVGIPAAGSDVIALGSAAVVPEPASLGLLALGALFLAQRRRR